jgi:hypothetical protein
MVKKVCNVLKSDTRLAVHHITNTVGSPPASVLLILKRDLGMWHITARWIPHLLTDKQKLVRLETAMKILKMFPKYQGKQFSDIITGDETWVHLFKPTRKVSNKIWASKHCRHPLKKAMFVILFDIYGPVIQLVIPNRRSVSGLFYKEIVLIKQCLKHCPNTRLKYLSLLQCACTYGCLCDLNFEQRKCSNYSTCTLFPRSSPVWLFLFWMNLQQTRIILLSCYFYQIKNSIVGYD